MNHIARFVAQTVVAFVMVLPIFAQPGPRSHALDEDGALALLEQTFKHDGVYAHLQPAPIFNLSFAKTTKPNAAEIHRRVP